MSNRETTKSSAKSWNSSRQSITKHIFRLVSFCDGYARASGTAIPIGRGIIATAAHVLRDHWDNHETVALQSASARNFDLLAFGDSLNGDGPPPIYIVDKGKISSMSDLAVMQVLPWNEVSSIKRWHSVRLNIHPPTIGDTVAAFGFCSSRVEVRKEGDFHTIVFDDLPWTALGNVLEIHPIKRDHSMLNFPCFRVNARYRSGMSGGPIFNSLGRLCGLVCSSLDDDSDSVEGVSYGTILWPMMNLSASIDGFTYRLLDLARKGDLQTEGWEQCATDHYID